jgi:hypothetical protein
MSSDVAGNASAKPSQIETRSRPRQGISASFRNAWVQLVTVDAGSRSSRHAHPAKKSRSCTALVLKLKTKPLRGSAIPKKHDSLGGTRRFNNLPLRAGAPPAPARSNPSEAPVPLLRFLLTSRPISYIMLTTKSGRIHAYPTPPRRRLSGLLPLSYFLSAVFPSFNWASS